MDAIVFIVICWVAFSLVIGELGPFLLEGAVYLIDFLFICLREVLKLLALAVYRSAQGIWQLTVFLFILADEWRRGPRDEETGEEENPDHDQEGFGEEREEMPPPDPYEEAMALLGLPPGFSRTALQRAWKEKIRQVHPDAGGPNEEAQAINAARDFIAARKGWR
jgi:hypothetical protein